MLSYKYRWNERLFDDLFCMCLALTNCDVKSSRLRQADTTDATVVCSCLRSMAKKQIERLKVRPERSARVRLERMARFVKRIVFKKRDSE